MDNENEVRSIERTQAALAALPTERSDGWLPKMVGFLPSELLKYIFQKIYLFIFINIYNISIQFIMVQGKVPPLKVHTLFLSPI
jgi:hypothetical protein